MSAVRETDQKVYPVSEAFRYFKLLKMSARQQRRECLAITKMHFDNPHSMNSTQLGLLIRHLQQMYEVAQSTSDPNDYDPNAGL